MPNVVLLPLAIMVKETENLPNRIREWRLRRNNMRLEDLAEKVGTTTSQIARMERGDRTVSLDWLDRLALALDVTPGDLLAKHANPGLPDEREKELLKKIREGGEGLLRTVEAVADVQRSFTGAPADVGTPAQGDADRKSGTQAA